MAIRCSSCGHVAAAGDSFCGKCGTALPAAEDTTPPATTDEDSSWVSLAGEPAAVAPPPVDVAPAPVVPEPALEPAAPLPPPETPVASYDDPAPPARRPDKGLWIAVVAAGLAGALALVVWTMGWTGGGSDDRAEIAAEADDPATPDEDWQNGYQDVFLSQDELSLVTSAEARQRDYPTTEGTTVQRTLPANTQVTGRWVRGRDPTTKWLKLAGGGYIWEGNLAQPGGEGSPIEISLARDGRGFGPEIGTYLDEARAQQRAYYARAERLPAKERDALMADIEAASNYVRVPSRRWRGLTVTAVAQHYESHTIYFRDELPAVRRALTAAGVRLDREDNVILAEDAALGCSIYSNDAADMREYGATLLTCGV